MQKLLDMYKVYEISYVNALQYLETYRTPGNANLITERLALIREQLLQIKNGAPIEDLVMIPDLTYMDIFGIDINERNKSRHLS